MCAECRGFFLGFESARSVVWAKGSDWARDVDFISAESDVWLMVLPGPAHAVI